MDPAGGFQAYQTNKVTSAKLAAECETMGISKTLSPISASQMELLFHRLGMFPSMVASGDSGGPLYCRKSKGDPWKLFGVNSQTIVIRLQSESEMEVIYSNLWSSAVDKEFQAFLKR